MFEEKKKIAIILTAEAHQPTLGTEEFQGWLDQQIEIGLIAFPQAVVFEKKQVSNQWEQLAEYITKHRDEFKGFIILTHLDSLLSTSAAISFMVQGLNKPLIFSSSPNSSIYATPKELTDDFGIRANLLNSLQVAIINVHQPAIVFGNRIIKSTRAIRTYDSSINLFQSLQTPLLGSIDFGVHIEDESLVGEKEFQLSSNFESRIFVVDMIPGVPNGQIPVDAKGIICRSAVSKEWIDLHAHDRPVLLWNTHAPAHPLTVEVEYMTWEAAVIKFGWAMAQTQDMTELRMLMAKNVVGELDV